MSQSPTQRKWMKYMTYTERLGELEYRKIILNLPADAPRATHQYPEFFTTSTYYIHYHFTMVQDEFLMSSFGEFEESVRLGRAKKWLRTFFAHWSVQFPEEAGRHPRPRNKAILKTYINALADYWNSEEGRPQAKEGRMDVMMVRIDILHEYVEDFDVYFGGAVQSAES